MASQNKPKMFTVRTRPEDGSTIILYIHDSGRQELTIKVTDEVLEHVKEDHNEHVFEHSSHELVLAFYDPKTKRLTTYPTTLIPRSKYFGLDKYISLQAISFEDARPIFDGEEDEEDGGRFHLNQFPSGFSSDPFDGFGLIYPLRFIVEAIEEFPDVQEIRMCRDKEISKKDGIFRLPRSVYEPVRKAVNRMHNAAVNFANVEKRTFLRTQFVEPFDPENTKSTFRRSKAELQSVLYDAASKPGRKSATRSSNESAAVRAVKSSIKGLLSDDREELLELNREIELVTLEDVIAKFEAKLANESLKEGSWQKFLSNNPFILKLAFGLPAIVFREQMPVGGLDLDNKGGKLADFVMKSGELGNLAIVEIKTPKAKLLGKTEYRGGIHAPSAGISGAVTQVMDQRYLLQENLNSLLKNTKTETAYSYAIGCIVIIGKTPTAEAQRKSFELYRTNLRDVTVITFDELLAKLKALHAFLVEPPVEEVEEWDVADEDEFDIDEDEDLEDDEED